MASFKKRTLKGNVRRGDSSLARNDDDEEIDGDKLGTVSEIKMEQKLRQKKLGAEFSTDGPATGSLASSSSRGESANAKGTNNSSSLGSQFESRIDVGLSAGRIAHEKIMQEYINERLGLKTSDESAPDAKKLKVSGKEDDELYKVPDELKVMGVSTVTSASSSSSGKTGDAAAAGAEDTSMLTWSLGLAEVALPMSFKMKNIEETEKARRKLEEERMANRAAHRAGMHTISSAVEAVGVAVSTSTLAAPSVASAASSSSSSLLAAARFWPAHLQQKKNEEREKQKAEVVDVLQGPMPEMAPTASSREFGAPAFDTDSAAVQGQGQNWGNKPEFRGPGGRGGGGRGGGGRGHRQTSNDDFVFQRYKKNALR